MKASIKSACRLTGWKIFAVKYIMMIKVVRNFVILCAILQHSIQSLACDGRCEPISCNKAKIAREEESVLFDLRFQNNECDHTLEICCPLESINTNEITPIPANKINKCGVRNNDGVGVRIEGNLLGEAQYGELPWMLMVLKSTMVLETEKLQQIGSGSLISQNVALTAAHILTGIDSDELNVRAGEWDSQKESELFPVQERKVKRVIKHEGYDSQYNNNIALLIFNYSLELHKHIQPICLPSPTVQYDPQSCLTGGWGKKKYGDEQQMHLMKRVKLALVDHDRCEQAFKSTRLGSKFSLHKSYICAGGEEGVDTCTGDGGSPLVCPGKDNLYYQIGIVAWGIGCGQKDIPGAYTNVLMFADWINKNLEAVE